MNLNQLAYGKDYENLMYGTPPHLEAAFSFGYVLLGVEEDDIDLGHVEHPQRHRGRQAEGDGQGGSLDIHLRGGRQRETESFITFQVVRGSLRNRPNTDYV